MKNRATLEKNGIRFAPIEIAEQFSYQVGPIPKNFFGFHAPENLPSFINEGSLISAADEIIERIPQPVIILRYLDAVLRANFYTLFKTSISNYMTKPNLVKAINFDRVKNPKSKLLDLIVSLN